MKNGWLTLAGFSLAGIAGFGLLKILFRRLFDDPFSTQANTASGPMDSAAGGFASGVMGGGMDILGGRMGPGMMNGGMGPGAGMMNGGETAVADGEATGETFVSFLGSYFSFGLTLMLVLAVLGFLAGIVGFAISRSGNTRLR